MFARCPKCQTLFRISLDQLEAADGKVRCGSCLTVFDARETLQSFEDDRPFHKSDPSHEGKQAKPGSQPETLQDRAFVPSILLDDLEAEKRSSPRRSTSRNFLYLLLILLLLMGLVAQAFYFERQRLAQITPLRPLLGQLCDALDCQLPPQQDLEQIELLDRNVHSHPNIRNALLISVTLINNANFSQPFPKLVISMANLQGKSLVGRTFSSDEYLPSGQRGSEMQPGVPITIMLEVADPGQEALNFEINFLP